LGFRMTISFEVAKSLFVAKPPGHAATGLGARGQDHGTDVEVGSIEIEEI